MNYKFLIVCLMVASANVAVSSANELDELRSAIFAISTPYTAIKPEDMAAKLGRLIEIGDDRDGEDDLRALIDVSRLSSEKCKLKQFEKLNQMIWYYQAFLNIDDYLQHCQNELNDFCGDVDTADEEGDSDLDY